jgi:hypothetical protein
MHQSSGALIVTLLLCVTFGLVDGIHDACDPIAAPIMTRALHRFSPGDSPICHFPCSVRLSLARP